MTAQPGARIEPREPQQRTGDSQVMERIPGASPRHLARIAGGLYLIIIVAGFFAIGLVPATIVVPGDAAATAHNILTHELLYRLGLVAHIIILPCNIALALISSQAISYNIQQVIYAGYLLAAGYLVFRSTFLPRTVGVLLAIGGLCYLTNSFATFLAPEFAAGLFPYIQVPSGVAELSLCLWFLVMGVNVQRWKEQASKASEPDHSVPGRAAV